ncbi:N-lysine methyltransferase SMYD2-A-like isoform X2 [Salvelinus alpinus]|uniref:N-lysine methyltransferase SMYD2-A-like isoform X2 n=1 Tax=Salvelinus alpinus TaxID=8036 RepID=UPI0039FD374F
MNGIMKNEGIAGTERFASPGKGRGLRAVKHFAVGDLVFACPAYSYVLTVNERGAHCEYCFTRREGLSKCGKCKQAYYCEIDCQKGDWPMHKLECTAMCSYGENWCPSETVRLVARIIMKQVGRKSQRNGRSQRGCYSSASLKPVNCNGFTIEDEELSHLGSAVFPDVALMNHSCSPNVIVTYKGTEAEVRAVQDIQPGDEIFNSYIDLLYPTDDRNERLRDSYFFTCVCNECATRSKDGGKMALQKLSSPPQPEEVRKMVHYARNVIEEFRRAKHYKTPSDLLEICEFSQEKMSSIFADTNVYILHMMYQAMGVCLYMQDWDGAMSYGEKIIQPYSVHYPAYSLNVASMYLKLGRLYLGLERKTQGVKALKKAIAIMEVAHGKDHHYVTEVKQEVVELK